MLLGSQSTEHEPNHGDVDQRLAGIGPKLVVLAEPALSAEPSEGALYDPSAGKDDEASSDVRALDDLHVDRPEGSTQPADPGDELSRVSSVRPDLAQPEESVRERGQKELRAIAVLNVSRMNDDRQEEPQRVDEDVPLPTTDFLARIVTARPPSRWF